jgi:hypothetical protein
VSEVGPIQAWSLESNKCGPWSSLPQWIPLRKNDFSIQFSRYAKANLELSRFQLDIDGLYLKLNMKQNICNRPHYQKKTVNAERHIFFDDEMKRWVICPRGDLRKGILAKSTGESLFEGWSICVQRGVDEISFTSPPPDVGVNAVAQTRPEVPQVSKAHESTPQNFHSETQTENGQMLESKLTIDDLNEYFKMENFFSNTLKWSQSNHNVLIFSHLTKTVNILTSENQYTNFHPDLKKFLLLNGISCGKPSQIFPSRYGEILAAITEVNIY